MLVVSSFTSCFVLQAVLPALQVLVGWGMMDADSGETSFLQLALAELQNP